MFVVLLEKEIRGMRDECRCGKMEGRRKAIARSLIGVTEEGRGAAKECRKEREKENGGYRGEKGNRRKLTCRKEKGEK